MSGRLCAYHVFSLGWHDIAYNFLIDRWQHLRGRAAGHPGDLRRPHKGVQLYSSGGGAHRRHTSSAPSPAALESLEHLLAWARSEPRRPNRFVHGDVARLGDLPFGDMVTLPNIAGHRDAQATSCPGDACRAPRSVKRSRSEGAKIYGGFDIEPTPTERTWCSTSVSPSA